MRKPIIATFLGILLIAAFGAAVVSAVASDNAGANYGFGSMHRWAARYMDSGSRGGNFSYCPYFNSSKTVELKVKTADEALEIAKKEIDNNVSKDDITQIRRWWLVSYQDKDGTYRQARIDAVSGKVFTDYPACPGTQAGGMYGSRGQGYCRT
jgi:Peptidase propeptide and YPEB domain.